MYSRIPVTRTLRANEKQFELARNSSYRSGVAFSEIVIKGKELNLVRVSGEFQLPEFELSRFYCIQAF